MFFIPFLSWNLESSLFSNCSQSLLKPCCIFSAEYNEERWFISRYEPLIHSNPLSVLVSGLFPEIYSYVPAILMWGGTTKPHCDAQEDSWRKILAYLQHHLYSSPTPKAKMWRRTHTEGAHTLFDTGYFSLLYFLFPVSCVLEMALIWQRLAYGNIYWLVSWCEVRITVRSKLQMNRCSFYDLPQWEEPITDAGEVLWP